MGSGVDAAREAADDRRTGAGEGVGDFGCDAFAVRRRATGTDDGDDRGTQRIDGAEREQEGWRERVWLGAQVVEIAERSRIVGVGGQDDARAGMPGAREYVIGRGEGGGVSS